MFLFYFHSHHRLFLTLCFQVHESELAVELAAKRAEVEKAEQEKIVSAVAQAEVHLTTLLILYI